MNSIYYSWNAYVFQGVWFIYFMRSASKLQVMLLALAFWRGSHYSSLEAGYV